VDVDPSTSVECWSGDEDVRVGRGEAPGYGRDNPVPVGARDEQAGDVAAVVHGVIGPGPAVHLTDRVDPAATARGGLAASRQPWEPGAGRRPTTSYRSRTASPTTYCRWSAHWSWGHPLSRRAGQARRPAHRRDRSAFASRCTDCALAPPCAAPRMAMHQAQKRGGSRSSPSRPPKLGQSYLTILMKA
jgi:hypothetical protein